ncbi:hypothetical protein [Paenibacillus sp. GP183]|jgi:hypothetical protein|uniref:hypothetical protein n=1 Tax=Paenibacillus sp. GP183 TaxID=1882751 RepID=UPI00089450E4|nr:hypothetical protein [Paenibacillus sp. GP183]SEB59214.1 hypothetical protein SAMN05443246_1233 [Paenibacillus sp. GP183]
MKRYKVINAKTAMLISLASMFLTVLLVFLIGHRSVFIKLELTLGILALVLFCFFCLGLYMGFRMQNDPFFKEGWKPFKGKWDSLDLSSAGSLMPFEIVGEGLWGFLLSILAWIAFSLVMVLLLFLIGNMLWGVIFFMIVMLYWLFYRAYRNVFLKSRYCRNRAWRSLAYGSLYTVLYTGWAFLLLQVGAWVIHMH